MDSKFIVLLLVNLGLIFLIRATKNRKKLNNFIILIFTILLTFTLVESGYRLFFKKAGPVEKGNFGGSLNTPVELTGFTIKNIKDLHVTKFNAKGDTLYDAIYTIIPDTGFNTLPINHRVGYKIDDANRDSVEIIFLGCSFTFATGIADTATMAYRVGRQLQYNSLNYGTPGWGTHQAYQVVTNKYQQVKDRKKRFFVYTLIPDHFLRAKCIYSWCLNDPYFEVKNDSLVLRGSAYKYASSARSQAMVRLLSLNRTLSFISDIGNNIVQQKGAGNVKQEDYKRGELMLSTMIDIARRHGDDFILLHWDDYKGMKNQEGGYWLSPDSMNMIMRKMEKKGATIVRVSEFFDFTDKRNLIREDNHPSEYGNSLLANRICDLIRKKLQARK